MGDDASTVGSAALPSPTSSNSRSSSSGLQKDADGADGLMPRGGSGGRLPFYLFLNVGSEGDHRKVDPRCPNASNPYHVCTIQCSSKFVEDPKNGIQVNLGRKSNVDPRCPNASNPFHECANYCFASIGEEHGLSVVGNSGRSKRNERKQSALSSAHAYMNTTDSKENNRRVDPRCVNASNPYHSCTENCIILSDTADQNHSRHRRDSKPQKGKAFSGIVQRKDVRPDCVYASNPFHRCSDYCLNKTIDR